MALSKFISDNDIHALMSALDNFPDQIREAEFALQCTDDAVPQSVIDDYEANTLAEVLAELKDDGKPKYTNKEQRESAVKARLSSDTEYAKLKDELRQATNDKREKQSEMFRRKEQYKGIVAKAYLVASLVMAEAKSNELQSKTQGV